MPVTNIAVSYWKVSESLIRMHIQFMDSTNRLTVPRWSEIILHRNGSEFDRKSPPPGNAEIDVWIGHMPAGDYKIVIHADSVQITYGWGTFYEPEASFEESMKGDSTSEQVLRWMFTKEWETTQTVVSLPDYSPEKYPDPTAPAPPSSLEQAMPELQQSVPPEPPKTQVVDPQKADSMLYSDIVDKPVEGAAAVATAAQELAGEIDKMQAFKLVLAFGISAAAIGGAAYAVSYFGKRKKKGEEKKAA